MLLAAACALLGACGHWGSSGAALVKRHADPTTAAAGPAADPDHADMVSAVAGNGGDDGQLGLKFQVNRRPVAGQPVVVALRLVPKAPLEHLEARFRPDDGLDITAGGEFDPEGHLEAGTAVDHTLTLLPAHDGVFTVMATVTTGSADEAVSRSFVIPLVVDAAPAPTNAAAAKHR
jgi:hypothetical protein